MSLLAMFAASTGMDAQTTRINNIANNLANLNTSGFKAGRESFEDLMYEQVRTPGVSTGSGTVAPVGIQIGSGTHLTGVYKVFTDGELSQTNRELDVAISGSGFFQVTLDNGETAYTRDGGLRLSSDGALVNSDGLRLTPSTTIPTNATSFHIAQDGTMSAIIPGQTAPQSLGTLTLAVFRNPAGLKAIGKNLYQATNASGTATTANPGATGAGILSQGYLEGSNVNVAEELINMIVAQRTYEANSKVLTTANEMMRTSNNIV